MKGFLMGFVHAGRGIAAGVRGQRNIKVMLLAAAVAVVLGVVRDITSGEWVAVVLSMGLVISLELVNTAGEKLVDILSPEHDPRYGMIKDVLAGAVLVAAVTAGVVGVFVFVL